MGIKWYRFEFYYDGTQVVNDFKTLTKSANINANTTTYTPARVAA